ncbi:DUF3995 domain-containing protein [Leucobacter sp. UCMA 4100]|uniref:DUF3995 domain-containing protein n=1 Tax=Leucobacter sp. UCMA 4100 TaxID=2810534 RepID=UPI0022EA1AF6|nr:DUF3995 domain-containing protein [Leucobacter sp. UCMA 4100]MDA3148026.1 DUF3995 domain-containing protein [Leucobacter sp. UCMA 4100]
MSVITSTARFISWAGLTAAGAVHAVWATGSSWPAKNAKKLGSATVGSTKATPSPGATAAVAGAALSAGAIAAGGLGEGRTAVGLRRLMGLGMIARAVAGGDATLRALGLAKPNATFTELDRRYYRPLFGALGVALLLGAKKKR